MLTLVSNNRKFAVCSPLRSVLVDSWLPCKDPSGLKGKEKGLDYLPAFAKASNNQIWPCIVEKVCTANVFHSLRRIFSSLCRLLFFFFFDEEITSLCAFVCCVGFWSLVLSYTLMVSG